MADDLLRKVNSVLSRKLKDFESGLEHNPISGRILGVAISSDFEDIDHGERQQILKRALTDELSAGELRRVGPIVTMTPNEASLHQEAAEMDAGD
jgi:hypothetical protein